MNGSFAPYLHRKVVVVDAHTPTQFVARAMRNREVGCVVIADHDELVGIVTDRDIAINLVAENFSPETPVREIMTEGVVAVSEEDDIEDVLQHMEFEGIRRVPIVNNFRHRRQRCLGIVSLDDLLMDGKVPQQRLQNILAQQVLDRGISEVSESRHRARKEHKYNEFRKKVAQRAQVDTTLAEIVYKEMLSKIVQRLPLNGATQFISQLPALLQDELLSVPVGPNKEITALTIVNNLMAKTNLDKEDVRTIVQDIWQTIGELTSVGEMDDAIAQLPNDFSELLTGFSKTRYVS